MSHSGPTTFSRVTISGFMAEEPKPILGDEGGLSHVTFAVTVGESLARIPCTAFNGTARNVHEAGIKAGEHVILQGRLRPGKRGDGSIWVEIQEIGVGVRELGEGDDE